MTATRKWARPRRRAVVRLLAAGATAVATAAAAAIVAASPASAATLFSDNFEDGSTDYYGIASTMDAGVLVEDNVFENVVQACWTASGYADSGPARAGWWPATTSSPTPGRARPTGRWPASRTPTTSTT